jgi:alkylation response protein AidB-like acyl-CoA dehydrogenase
MMAKTVALEDEQVQAMRDMARNLAKKNIEARAAEIDVREEFPWHVVEAFREAGLLSLLVPEEYGGVGGSVIHESVIAEELARIDVSSAIIFTSHSLCTEIVKYMATKEQ